MENRVDDKKIYKYLILAFFIVFIGTGLFLVNSKKSTSDVVKNSIEQKAISFQTEPTEATENYLRLSAVSTSVNKGENTVLDIIADSNGKNISGYDIVLSYNPIAFDFSDIKSTLPDFKIYSYKKNNYLTFLGTKILQSKRETIFKGEKIATLTYKALKSGQYEFALKEAIDKDKTDFVTSQTEIIKPLVNKLKVEIK
jgi:hypothetical protein